MSCDFECQKDIYLESKKKTFNKKLEEYYSQYSKYLRELQELSKKDDPHQAMQEKRRRYEGKLMSLENQIKNVVYNSDAVVFEKQTIGDFTITTGFSWNTVDDLRYGKKHVDDWCYLRKSGTTLDYYFDRDASQNINLSAMNITKSEAESYRKYCSN